MSVIYGLHYVQNSHNQEGQKSYHRSRSYTCNALSNIQSQSLVFNLLTILLNSYFVLLTSKKIQAYLNLAKAHGNSLKSMQQDVSWSDKCKTKLFNRNSKSNTVYNLKNTIFTVKQGGGRKHYSLRVFFLQLKHGPKLRQDELYANPTLAQHVRLQLESKGGRSTAASSIKMMQSINPEEQSKRYR